MPRLTGVVYCCCRQTNGGDSPESDGADMSDMHATDTREQARAKNALRLQRKYNIWPLDADARERPLNDNEYLALLTRDSLEADAYARKAEEGRAAAGEYEGIMRRAHETGKRKPRRGVVAKAQQGVCDGCQTPGTNLAGIRALGSDHDELSLCPRCWQQYRARAYTGRGCDVCRGSLRKGRVTLYDADGESITICPDCHTSMRHARATRAAPKMTGDSARR